MPDENGGGLALQSHTSENGAGGVQGTGHKQALQCNQTQRLNIRGQQRLLVLAALRWQVGTRRAPQGISEAGAMSACIGRVGAVPVGACHAALAALKKE